MCIDQAAVVNETSVRLRNHSIGESFATSATTFDQMLRHYSQMASVSQRKESTGIELVEFGHVIMVFGKTGSGVSSTVNSILGWKACPIGSGMHSMTQEIQSESSIKKKIQVIDMPDLVSMDREYNSDWKSRDVLSRWTRVPLHAALYVIRSDERYTSGQYEIYLKMREKLDDLISQENLIIVFTHGKFLEKDVFLRASGELQCVLKDAGYRYVVMDNYALDDSTKRDVCRLLTMVDKLRNPLAPDRIPDMIEDKITNFKRLAKVIIPLVVFGVVIIIIVITIVVIKAQ